MKVGDLIRWKFSAKYNHFSRMYGLIIGKDDVFFRILWENGQINEKIDLQMEVIYESR